MYQAELLENLAGQLSDQSHLIEQMSHKMTLIFEALGTQNKFNAGMFEKLIALETKEQNITATKETNDIIKSR
jgi:hypothetical protein